MKVDIMPAKKTTAVAKSPAEDIPNSVLSLKGTLEYRRWVNDLAAHCRTTTASTMDLALADYARQVGFPRPAPKRNVHRRGPSPRDGDRKSTRGKTTGPEPRYKDTRGIILSLKVTPAHRRWLNDLATYCRTTAVNVMDLALVSHARQAGFSRPAPKRNAVN